MSEHNHQNDINTANNVSSHTVTTRKPNKHRQKRGSDTRTNNYGNTLTAITGTPRSGAEGNRTPDLNSAIVALYQLSYSPVAAKCTVGVGQRRKTSERTGSSSR